MAAMVAEANTVTEWVVWVSHQTRANCTRPLPSSEKTYPLQIIKNGFFQPGLLFNEYFNVLAVLDILHVYYLTNSASLDHVGNLFVIHPFHVGGKLHAQF